MQVNGPEGPGQGTHALPRPLPRLCSSTRNKLPRWDAASTLRTAPAFPSLLVVLGLLQSPPARPQSPQKKIRVQTPRRGETFFICLPPGHRAEALSFDTDDGRYRGPDEHLSQLLMTDPRAMTRRDTLQRPSRTGTKLGPRLRLELVGVRGQIVAASTDHCSILSHQY